LNIPFLPERASNFASEYDALFYTLTALTIIFTVIVGSLVLFFSIRYRKGHKVNRSGAVESHMGAELTWTVIPLILGLMMFGWSARLFIRTRTIPKDAMEIFVIGKQWMWHIQHGNGVRENNELHVPVGVPVRLTMISQDVIHGFFIPQFRIKQDVLPGRYTQQWFIATKAGRYNLECSKYCGTGHSEMGGYVYAMPPRDFQKWLESGGSSQEPPQSMEEAGARLYEKNACGSCHTAADNQRAPTLYAIYGRERTLDDGSKVVADEAYIRESILSPYAKIVKGYRDTMPEYKDQFTEDEVLQLIAYIKSLGMLKQTPITETAAHTTGRKAR
jgi:cytochrome c oxidase subunit 2